jgi:peroxiredoxin Q/BCP
MSLKTIILIILFVWGAPSTYFRSKFRKIVYKTDDWKINIKPLFIKEIKGLIFNIYPENSKYLKIVFLWILPLQLIFFLKNGSETLQ